MTRKQVLALCCVIALAAEACLAAAPVPWAAEGFAVRRTVRLTGQAETYGRKGAGVVEFVTGGLARPDGADVRVYAGAKPTPHRVLWAGPGSELRVAFELVHDAQEYQAYYGNAKATEPSKWWPEVGLVLETRKFVEGTVKDLPAARRLFARPEQVYGRNFVPNVFHGVNPFGPSDSYFSIYTGPLYIAQAGEYTFATASDDESLVVVDGKVVARKGPGHAEPDARFHGDAIKLTAGLHSFEYYHTEGIGEQCAVAAWKPPGGEFQPIPRAAFPKPVRAALVDLEIRGWEVSPDYRIVNAGDVIFNGEPLVRMAFSDQTAGQLSLQCQPKWYFGDGTASSVRNPEHIYLAYGTYPVVFQLTRGEKVYKVTHQLVVAEGWDRQLEENHDKLEKYVEIIKDYPFDPMPVGLLSRAADILEEFSAKPQLIAVGRAALARKADLKPDDLVRFSILLGKAIRDHEGNLDEALKVFREAEGQLASPAAKAKLAVEAGDVFLYFKRDLDAAQKEYERVLAQLGKAQDTTLRIAQIRIGDIHRRRGEYAPALAAYKKADAMKLNDLPFTKDAVRVGALAQSVEDYIRRKELDEAAKQLDTWEWEYPEEKLAGYASLLRARLAMARGNEYEAINQVRDIVKVNPNSTHAPELLLLEARAHIRINQFDDAAKCATRVAEEYQDSPLQQEAKLLGVQALAGAGKHEQAVESAGKFLQEYPASDQRPAALLALADSYLALKRKPEALKALNELVQKHPDSPLVGEARKRLAEMTRK